MRMTILLLSLVGWSACKSAGDHSKAPRQEEGKDVAQSSDAAAATAGTTADQADAKPRGSDIVLKKMVGALSKEDPKAQHYECTVKGSDVGNLQQVQQWIAEVAKAPLVDAFYFRAAIPSIQIFAYQNGEEVLLFESYSKARYRRPSSDGAIKNDTAEELIKIAHQKCPYP